jgi:hypothetical protein
VTVGRVAASILSRRRAEHVVQSVRARTGEEAELWLDAAKLRFFDEQSGDALTFAR